MRKIVVAKRLVRLAKVLLSLGGGDGDDSWKVAVFFEGMQMFAREAKLRGMGVEGPFKVIGGVRMSIWDGGERYTVAKTDVTITARYAMNKVSVGGIVDDKSIHMLQEIGAISGSIGPNDVATAIRIVGRKAGFWRR